MPCSDGLPWTMLMTRRRESCERVRGSAPTPRGAASGRSCPCRSWIDQRRRVQVGRDRSAPTFEHADSADRRDRGRGRTAYARQHRVPDQRELDPAPLPDAEALPDFFGMATCPLLVTDLISMASRLVVVLGNTDPPPAPRGHPTPPHPFRMRQRSAKRRPPAIVGRASHRPAPGSVQGRRLVAFKGDDQ